MNSTTGCLIPLYMKIRWLWSAKCVTVSVQCNLMQHWDVEGLHNRSNVNNHNSPIYLYLKFHLFVYRRKALMRDQWLCLFCLISNDGLSQKRELVEIQCESLTGGWGESLWVLAHVQVWNRGVKKGWLVIEDGLKGSPVTDWKKCNWHLLHAFL